MNTPFGSSSWNSLSNTAEQINRYWGRMGRERHGDGYGNPWWGMYGLGSSSPLSKATTTYKCDAKLGRPQHVDCSMLQYSQLDHEDDRLTLQPGLSKFLHSQTCNIGISVSRSTSVTWRQIKAAVDTIIEACVNNPLTSATGGRAFYGHQNGFNIDIFGKKRKRDPDSMNALPLGVNITLFQQFESFPTPPTDGEEMESCTWLKALHNQDVRSCQSVHHRPHPWRHFQIEPSCRCQALWYPMHRYEVALVWLGARDAKPNECHTGAWDNAWSAYISFSLVHKSTLWITIYDIDILWNVHRISPAWYFCPDWIHLLLYFTSQIEPLYSVFKLAFQAELVKSLPLLEKSVSENWSENEKCGTEVEYFTESSM